MERDASEVEKHTRWFCIREVTFQAERGGGLRNCGRSLCFDIFRYSFVTLLLDSLLMTLTQLTWDLLPLNFHPMELR